MPVVAHSVVSNEVNSLQTGTQLGNELVRRFAKPPAAVVLYTTISHDHAAVLRGLRRSIGPSTLLVGCSSQGVMTRGRLLESGYVAGVMGIGGDGVETAGAIVHQIHEDARQKGRGLGEALLAKLSSRPEAVVIHHDPLCSADIGHLLAGLHEVVRCPVVGGAAGQTWGPMVATFQFLGEAVYERSACALAIGGDLSAVVGACHGTTPLGIRMTVTRSAGTTLLELDGRRAADVWEELTGEGDPTTDHHANMAIGLPDEETDQEVYRVLAPFGIDEKAGGIVLQAGLPEGTEIMFHHRTEQSVLDGTRQMARDVRERLGERALHAVLGFECGARTQPFLGAELAAQENAALQEAIGADAAWLGMLAWGEVFPLRSGPAIFNYTFPILCLADRVPAPRARKAKRAATARR